LPPNGPIGAGPWASSPTPCGSGAVSGPNIVYDRARESQGRIVVFSTSGKRLARHLGPAQGMAKKPNPDAHTLCETEAGGRSSGKDIKFNQPAATGGHGEYKRANLHTISADFRVAYELLTGDLSQVNYSSIRAGLVETALMLVSNGVPQKRVPRRLVACDWPYWG